MTDADRLAALLAAVRDIIQTHDETITEWRALAKAYDAARHTAGVTLDPRPDVRRLAFAETQRFYNAGYASGHAAALEEVMASVLLLPNEDRDGYEERWVKRSGVTGIIDALRAALAPADREEES